MNTKIFITLTSLTFVTVIGILVAQNCPTEPDCCPACPAKLDCCAALERLEPISFYQDASESKNRDETMKKYADCCKRQNPAYQLGGTKRRAVQEKAGAFVS